MSDNAKGPAAPTVHVRVISAAARLLGSASDLAAALSVESDDVQRWLHAVEIPPEAVFLRTVEILLDPAEQLLEISAQRGAMRRER